MRLHNPFRDTHATTRSRSGPPLPGCLGRAFWLEGGRPVQIRRLPIDRAVTNNVNLVDRPFEAGSSKVGASVDYWISGLATSRLAAQTGMRRGAPARGAPGPP